MRVLVTGADGFVGSALIRLLVGRGHEVNAAARGISNKILPENNVSINWFDFDLDSENSSYNDLLKDVDIVVHLASKVHITHVKPNNPNGYKRTNTDGTRTLVQQAVNHGVKRFIYLSTIKVNGEYTDNYSKYSEDSPSNPADGYAISKYEAEQLLQDICARSDMESVIIRPPLIYGPGVKANFLQLFSYIEKGYPLPLASVVNLRSFIYLGNLCDAIMTCMEHPQAANQLFLVSDSDYSTPDLIRDIAVRMKRKVNLISCPVFLLRIFAVLFGRKTAIEKLTRSLLIDSSKIRHLLSWVPPYSSVEGLQRTVDWYTKRERKAR